MTGGATGQSSGAEAQEAFVGLLANPLVSARVNAVLFRALPFKNPDELAFVWTRLPKTSVRRALVSGPDFKDYQTDATRFKGFAGAVALPGTITGDGPPERITNAYVTWNMLSLLGVRPILGRTHVAEDAFPMDPKSFGNPDPKLPPNKVVLSYGLWQRRFGGDSSVIGRTIRLDGWGSLVIPTVSVQCSVQQWKTMDWHSLATVTRCLCWKSRCENVSC